MAPMGSEGSTGTRERLVGLCPVKATTIDRHALPWSVTQEGSHAYCTFTPTAPYDGATSRSADDPDLRALMRVFMANRGVGESGWWLGPTVSVAHTEADVDAYVEVFEEFVTTVAT